ncbi:DUF4303 domain-containing protein [Pseudomonas nicosulfuronedens]|uniref:DUF4303 domain-containing protein n=1 Tax=Pseudomonas nicosulfuronedens TaxID=2571105 RepID=A0A5R9R3I4_9PSED|nr:DUF4303 domain-containing protein [Pseudomonas nicosulfuronedens]MDH1010834.1 DUF4303 domain-containing protein [Pseudomonas nicosulfuronedens]MDH1979132.1 DUF4303 domain-containing protein [Pseudomonas nicosulfuronedens]MDH2026033.1 DUF4303 domain-containing protein [Pseudomonas nicosulfuronedens]TLX77230.1 DUF4303 domain-containing protein [Pseudomonas nicosulfuronedens]
MPSEKKFDWKALEDVAVGQVVNAVRKIRQTCPDETVYGAMFHEFYGDGSVLYWPMVTVGTEEVLARVATDYGDESEDLRWSGPDLGQYADDHGFEPGDEQDQWATQCAEFAQATAKGSFSAWEAVYERFLHCFPRAAKRARAQLLKEGLVDKHFIVVATDEAGELVPLSLTRAQLLRHFPMYDEAERERARIAALPLTERIAEVVSQAVRAAPPGPLLGEYDALARVLGEAAVPALLDVVAGRSAGEAWQASMLLAEINHSSPDVISTLEATLCNAAASESERAWAASALARLERMDLIAAHLSELPSEVAARGLSAPYRSFRDRGKHRPLDYRPLEAVLAQYPDMAPAVAEALAPGCGFCTLEADEVEAAQQGLTSKWAFIREHARDVLEEFEQR